MLAREPCGNGAAVGQDVAGLDDPGMDAHVPGLLGELALHKAHQQHRMGPRQALQQGEHVGFCAADVAAGDEVDDFHGIAPEV